MQFVVKFILEKLGIAVKKGGKMKEVAGMVNLYQVSKQVGHFLSKILYFKNN